MKSTFITLSILFFTSTLALSQIRTPDGGGAVSLPSDKMDLETRDKINAQLTSNIDSLLSIGKIAHAKPLEIELIWPLKAQSHLFDFDYHGISNFVDLNSQSQGFLLDYNCGQRTYDLDSGYNHAGIDFFTWPFGFNKMDDDDVAIVAAAPGVIIDKIDGNQDRSCSFNGTQWNAVYVRHADGSVAWYGHMKKNSTTEKAIGEEVEAGEYLGIVGSSGISTGPHLHFELQQQNGFIVEPFKGNCNQIEKSLWKEQRAYFDSGINALRTHSAGPQLTQCPQPDIPNYKDAFLQGEQIINAAYYRDQLEGQQTTYIIKNPSGQTFTSWNHSLLDVSHYSASYWWWSNDLPFDAEPGVWSFEAVFQSHTYTHEFTVSDVNTKPMAVTLQNPAHQAEILSPSQILRWLPLADAQSYELMVATDVAFTNIILNEGITGERMFSISNLNNETEYFWRVRATNNLGTGDWSETRSFNTGVVTSNEKHDDVIPQSFRLFQNYPNPFNPTTKISFELQSTQEVELVVYNLMGQNVATLVDGIRTPGNYTVSFDGKDLSSGIYFYRLTTENFTAARKMTLIK